MPKRNENVPRSIRREVDMPLDEFDMRIAENYPDDVKHTPPFDVPPPATMFNGVSIPVPMNAFQPSLTDVLGSYTGNPLYGEEPVQDQDDL